MEDMPSPAFNRAVALATHETRQGGHPMRTKNLHSRLPATVLCLCVMVLAASPPAFAQTLWDAQDQADMWGRLQAQGLIRSPESARAEAAKRGKPSAPARLHEAGRDDAAGADPRRRSGHGSGLRTQSTPEVTAVPDA
jgi:hypothetical protein